MRARTLLLVALALALAACGSAPRRGDIKRAPPSQAKTEPPRSGGYYKDDGPPARAPSDLDAVPDAQPRNEPLHRYANRPYQVFGKDYTPMTERRPFRQRGTASWYGRRFHGQSTSSGEPYDMYAMSAAHTVLPIPSYARVTNLATGRSVVVRINDRGPFHGGRIIDLSYAAAHRLGYINDGSARVEVEAILPGAVALAAAAPAPAQPAPRRDDPIRAESDVRGVYLQLGAFGARDNAESFRERVARELAWLSRATLHVFSSGELFKLQLGPFGTPDEALPVAERIETELNFKPLVVVR